MFFVYGCVRIFRLLGLVAVISSLSILGYREYDIHVSQPGELKGLETRIDGLESVMMNHKGAIQFLIQRLKSLQDLKENDNHSGWDKI